MINLYKSNKQEENTMLKIDYNNNRRYMQSAEFWQDKDNKKTAELIDKLMFHRDMLSTVSNSNPADFFQRTDGFVEQRQRTGLVKIIKSFMTYFDNMYVDSLNNNYKNAKVVLKRQTANVKRGLIK